ncbi:pirin family protein [Rhizobium sp. ICMP 5592]|uniref:pirin family protein n=1 Tax=Rhizobium sp. ICMP 5592 TaxID=2292445 RepID=UPI001295B290|nr:pirin family protein [Rhizobium sp. ICMP 5592]MQB40791.1 pirin family protein [Rhizobium sp. ICMP 5592]
MTLEATPIHGIGVVSPETHLVRAQGPFQLRRIRPGISLRQPDDAGFGGLGIIDHARLQPGLVVRMHEHRNDEIISYLRSGNMQHTDSAGRSEVISPGRLMVMNAGSGFSHEEEVVGKDQIEMLQIFVRPETADMKPGVQFVSLDEATRTDQWRLLTGPAGSTAPSFVRQAIYLYDTHLPAGKSIGLPSMPGFDRWLYVFRGSVLVGHQEAGTHTALTIGADEAALDVTATANTDLVLFLIDRRARFSREGTISG